ncbi:outer membrane protein assembly factor BamB [Photobacterium aphoticum]|uniref:Outer membrane protein assembly factor BamB n=3 Tax=Photobacterium aphoticum TaxID=754436 RepID=A0A0J1GRT1_9GAMM|nr:outer membrane protein assembly factor BamB [Photobacterium aphoticum]KLV02381.1 membrane biogenesis protein [Photobacterium aphoticum]PSU56401.1 outer membrane protein assembly factor BamB [Photobacterium aphoticum]GHA46615.1 outer membrane protein assembly factor BamB [Photobacterium aphoticum]
MQKVLKQAIAVALAAGLLAGCAGDEDTIQMAPLPMIESTFAPAKSWSSEVGDGIGQYFSQLRPALGYGKLFVAARDGKVKALDPDTGALIWERDLEGDVPARLSGGITLSYGKVYIGSENAEVIALDAETGELVWRSPVEGEVLSRPLLDEGLVVVNTSRGVLQALDADTGEDRWQLGSEVPTLTLRGDSSPVSISGGVFWGQANGRLAGALMNTGQMLWQQPIGSPKGGTEIDRLVDVDASPVIDGERLYAIGYNGNLVSIDLRTGQAAWKRSYSSATDFVIDGSQLFLITDQDHVVAVDIRSGTELWANKLLEYRRLSAPTIINGYVVVGDDEGYLHWLDPYSGDFVAQQEIGGGGIAVPPLVAGDGYVVVTRDGSINKMQMP